MANKSSAVNLTELGVRLKEFKKFQKQLLPELKNLESSLKFLDLYDSDAGTTELSNPVAARVLSLTQGKFNMYVREYNRFCKVYDTLNDYYNKRTNKSGK